MPQIADSTLLQPVFKFEEDTGVAKANISPPADTVKDTVVANKKITSIDTAKNYGNYTTGKRNTAVHTVLNTTHNFNSAENSQQKNDSDTLNMPVRQVSHERKEILHQTKEIIRFKGIERKPSDNLFFLTEILLVLSIVTVKIYQQRLFRKFINSVFSLSLLQDLEKESKTYSTPVFWIGFINYLVQASIFAHFYLTKGTAVDWNSLFQLGSIIFVFNAAKYFIYRISGVIFDKNELFANYGLYHFIILIISGFIFLIINILYVYTITSEYLLWTGSIVFFMLLIFKYISFLILSIQQKVSAFHIFLYLCTLEILPFIVAYNWFNL